MEAGVFPSKGMSFSLAALNFSSLLIDCWLEEPGHFAATPVASLASHWSQQSERGRKNYLLLPSRVHFNSYRHCF